MAVREVLQRLFAELNCRVDEISRERRKQGLIALRKAGVRLLGQVSLLSHKEASLILSLAQTGDLDALLEMEHVVREEFKSLLRSEGLVYDEDSSLVWIPPGAQFELLFDY